MSERLHEAERSSLSPAFFHILLSLADEDRHGYAVMGDVAERTNGTLKLGAATLYRSIQKMLEQGLITESGERPDPQSDDERRRYYRITPKGRSAAQAETERLAKLLKLAKVRGFLPGRV